MNDLLIKALITVMIIDAGMHFYYDYKKNTYQSLKFLILTVLMAVSVGAALTKQETDNVQQRMKIMDDIIVRLSLWKMVWEHMIRWKRMEQFMKCACMVMLIIDIIKDIKSKLKYIKKEE